MAVSWRFHGGEGGVNEAEDDGLRSAAGWTRRGGVSEGSNASQPPGGTGRGEGEEEEEAPAGRSGG